MMNGLIMELRTDIRKMLKYNDLNNYRDRHSDKALIEAYKYGIEVGRRKGRRDITKPLKETFKKAVFRGQILKKQGWKPTRRQPSKSVKFSSYEPRLNPTRRT